MGKGWKQQNACHHMESDSWICLPQDRTRDVIALLFLADDKGVMWGISRSRAVWQVSETLRVFWFSCINQLGQFSRRICFKAIMSSSYFPAIFISIFDKSGVRGNPELESLPFPTSNKCMQPPLNENNNNKVNDNTTRWSADLSHYYWWYLDISDKWASSRTRVNIHTFLSVRSYMWFACGSKLWKHIFDGNMHVLAPRTKRLPIGRWQPIGKEYGKIRFIRCFQ